MARKDEAWGERRRGLGDCINSFRTDIFVVSAAHFKPHDVDSPPKVDLMREFLPVRRRGGS
jgi:hypothetical protein